MSVKYEIIDSLPGTGKTNYVIQMINKAPKDSKFIYVAPYIEETKRLKKNVSAQEIHVPKDSKTTKTADIFKLIRQGKSIATTHSLFEIVSTMPDFLQLIENSDYHLIIDEVLSVIKDVENMDKSDVQLLRNHTDLIEVGEKGKVTWKAPEVGERTKYATIYQYANQQTLYVIRDSKFIRLFNEQLLKAFKKATVCTYLFNYSYMRMVLDLHEIEYGLKAIEYDQQNDIYNKVEYDVYKEDRAGLLNGMNVHMDYGQNNYNERINKAGVKLSYTGLSKAVSENNTEFFKTAESVTRGFFRSCQREEDGDCYHAILSTAEDYYNPKGYDKADNRMSISERATNKYINGKYLTYMYERNMNPMYERFFDDNDVDVSLSGYSVAELLQWIFRSQIRKGEDIRLLLPSEKMREVLTKWAKYEL